MYAVPVLIITVNWGSTVLKSTTCNWLFSNTPYYTLFAPKILDKLLSLKFKDNNLWCSSENAVHVLPGAFESSGLYKIWGANRVYYGGFENNGIYNTCKEKEKILC